MVMELDTGLKSNKSALSYEIFPGLHQDELRLENFRVATGSPLG